MNIQTGRQENRKRCHTLKDPFSYNKGSKIEDVQNTNCQLFQYCSLITNGDMRLNKLKCELRNNLKPEVSNRHILQTIVVDENDVVVL